MIAGDRHDPAVAEDFNHAKVTQYSVIIKLAAFGGVDVVYSFQPGRLHNLKADTIIGGHSDIKRPEVAHALLSAVART